LIQIHNQLQIPLSHPLIRQLIHPSNHHPTIHLVIYPAFNSSNHPLIHKSPHPLTQPISSWPFFANNSIVLTVIQSFKGYVATADADAAVDLRAPRRAPAIPGKTPPTARRDGHGGENN
jgi:hypothetical protein